VLRETIAVLPAEGVFLRRKADLAGYGPAAAEVSCFRGRFRPWKRYDWHIMAYSDSVEFLASLQSKGIHLDLGPVTRLLQRLGNPHERYPALLVAGTNGKGSVAAMISSILQEAGYTVGLYTSPHMTDFRERIQVNSRMIPPEELDDLIGRMKDEIREDITYFECATALAFLYFECRSVDIAVLEVGMGGRLDATNVVTPFVSVITNVSLEHTAYLGRSLAAIAEEKAGIIKSCGVCVTGATQPVVRAVIEKRCNERKARLYRKGKDIRVRPTGRGLFSYYGINKHFHNLSLALRGKHQIENAALSLGTVEVLSEKDFAIHDDAVAAGLKGVRWEGRLEVLNRNPLILVDGAHNPAAAVALSRFLSGDFSYERLILLFAALNDKNYRAMLQVLVPLADAVIVTKPDAERAVDPRDLADAVRPYTDQVWCVDDVQAAFERAMTLAGDGDAICVTGSFYLVGAIKRIMSQEVP
jgi:dihydrofolate synthase/folylpolyglutamate synthase